MGRTSHGENVHATPHIFHQRFFGVLSSWTPCWVRRWGSPSPQPGSSALPSSKSTKRRHSALEPNSVLLVISQLVLQSEFSCDYRRVTTQEIIILRSSQAGVSLLLSLRLASHPCCLLYSCVSQWNSNSDTTENVRSRWFSGQWTHTGRVEVLSCCDRGWLLTILHFCCDHHACMLSGAWLLWPHGL